MTSSYSTRNVRYIRASNQTVVPLIVYLKQDNVSWFTDHALQQVLAALQPVLMDKLNAFDPKKDGKNPLADVFRIDGIQFAYYLRPTESRHAVLLRNRTLLPAEATTTEESDEDEEVDRKPVLKTVLDGFYVSKKTLVVVPEPYDPQRKQPPDFLFLEHKPIMDIGHLFSAAASSNSAHQ